jgi:hypothetical protein
MCVCVYVCMCVEYEIRLYCSSGFGLAAMDMVENSLRYVALNCAEMRGGALRYVALYCAECYAAPSRVALRYVIDFGL